MWSQNLCRTCGQISEACHFIYTNDTASAIESKIKKCLNLDLFKSDYKPKQVCNTCLVKLNDFSEFIESSHSINLKFESIFCNSNFNSRNPSSFEYELPKHSVIVSNVQANMDNMENSEGNFYKSSESMQQSNFNGNVMEIVGCGDFPAVQSCLQYANACQNENAIPHDTVLMRHSTEMARETSPQPSYKETKIEILKYNDLSSGSALDIALDLGEKKPKIRELSLDKSKNNVISVETVRNSVKLQTSASCCTLNPKQKKLYPCPHCDRKFMRRGSLNAHVAVHTKLRPFVCDDCAKSFPVKSELTTHKKSHSDQHKCQYCLKKFAVPSKLKRHIRIHTNERPYVCDFLDCNKAFSDKRNLDGHAAMHFSERNFACPLCSKKFKSKSRLKQHSKCHACTVMYKCDLCSKKYKYKNNLINHIKKHVNVCPYCKVNCESNTMFVEHISTCKVRK